ncbi:hypothetical protein D3C73_846990 [compost metagenome]
MEQMKNIRKEEQIAALRAQLARLEPAARARGRPGDAAPLAVAPGRLHDLYAQTAADAPSANAFALGLALTAAGGRPLVWCLHDRMGQEAGQPYGLGLNELGLRPETLLLVRARDIQTLLAVGEEAARSPAVGAVVLSAWGEARALTLTASRRLAMAAASGGAAVLLTRAGAAPQPSAAETRWSVAAAASTPLEALAPGRPAFRLTLERSREGGPPRTWIMEWDRERRSFIEPASLSGDLVPLAAQRPAGTPAAAARSRHAA